MFENISLIKYPNLNVRSWIDMPPYKVPVRVQLSKCLHKRQ